jgi:hypothetical protein
MVVRESGLALLAHEAGVLEQAEVARNARLRDPEDRGELADVQALTAEQSQQPEPDVVAEQTVEGSGIAHIY